MSHPRTTDDQQNTSTSGGWLHSMVESLTPSVFTGLWASRQQQQRETGSPTSRAGRRNGCPPTRRDLGLGRDYLTDNPAGGNQQFEDQPDPESVDQPLNSTTTTSAVSHGAPVPLQQLGELVSRYSRPSPPKRPDDQSFVDANSNDRETASQYSNMNSFAMDSMSTSRTRKRPVETSEMDDQESSSRYTNDFKRFRYGMEPLARPSISSSANAFVNESSHSLFLDRSQADQSGRLSRMSYDRPPSSLSSASTTLRARISSVGSTGGPGSSALSSRTRRILEELEKMSTPVKDAQKLPTLRPWQPEPWDRNVNQIGAPATAATLRGPPLASLSTPTRAQLLSRTIGSNASKPYWRRPSATVSRTSAPVTTPSSGGIVKSVDGANINKFSARIPELEETDSSPHFNSKPLPIASSQVPAAGFLAGGNKFSFSKPVPKAAPVVSAAETPGVSSVMAAGSKWTCSSCFITNEADKDKCACCSEPRSAAPKKSETASTSAPSSGTTLSASSSGGSNSFLPKKGWSCSMCFVGNDESADACVACSEPRPGAPKSEKSKPLFPGSIFQSSSSSSSSENTTAATKKGWGCSMCFVTNDDSADKCVACSEARPGASKSDSNKSPFANSFSSTFTSSAENKAALPKKGWSCSTCFVSNDDAADQCMACCEPRPGAPKSDKNKPLFAGSIFSTSSSAAGSEVVAPKKDWSCTTCFVLNKADKLSCDACQSPKPGSTFKPVSFGLSAAASQPAAAIPPGVSFGITATPNESFSEKKTVKFAEPLTTTFVLQQPTSWSSSSSVIDDAASPDAQSLPSSFDSSTSNATKATVSPSVPTIESGLSTPSAPFGFAFGASKDASTIPPSTTTTTASSSIASGAPPPFAFGAPAAATTTTTSALPAPVSTSAFVFGSSSSVASTSTSSAASSLPTSVAASKTTEPTAVAVTTASGSSAAPSTSLFTFGGTASAPSTTTGASLFPSATSTFSFGSKPAASTSSTTGSALPAASAAPTLGFGAAAATTSGTGALFPSAAPPFSFGSSATTAAGAASTNNTSSFSTAATPAFNFGASATTTTTTTTASSTNNAPLFSTAATPSFNFGATSSTVAPSTTSGPSFSSSATPSFTFGAAASAAAVPSTSSGPLFPTAGASTFTFGSSAAATTAASTNNTSSFSTAVAPAFNFGGTPSAAAPSANSGGLFSSASAPSVFGFGSSGGASTTTTGPSAAPGSQSIFAFGSRPMSGTADGGARSAFNLPSTFAFGEQSSAATGQSTDTSPSPFQFQSGAPPNPFLPSTTGASAKQPASRKMLTAHRRKRQ